jgi:hypothetical protein
MQSQETPTHSIVDNFLIFQRNPHVTYFVKPNQSYRNRKNNEETSFSAESWKQIRRWRRLKLVFQTRLQEQVGQKRSMTHDFFRLELNFKRHMFQFRFALSDRICPEWAVITKLAVDIKWYRFRKSVLYKSCRYLWYLSREYLHALIRQMV